MSDLYNTVWIAEREDPNDEFSPVHPKELPLDYAIIEAARNESPLFDSLEAVKRYISEVSYTCL